MSDIAVAGGRTAWRDRPGTGTRAAGQAPDTRRTLQLILAAVWLLDAALQFQPFMYGKAFGRTLAAAAAGDPGVIARPVTWDAALVGQHPVLLNTIFATAQLLLAAGIMFRPTARLALGASIGWAIGVWWFGEGLGGVLTGSASPVSGAPGAVIIYALLAVLLWPADRDGEPAPFTAARAIGTAPARALWLVLWLSLAYFALLPASRVPQGLSGLLSNAASGEPRWLAAVDRGAAQVIAGQGLAGSIVLAAAFTLIAAGLYLPRPAATATLLLAIVVAMMIWVFGEAFGAILTGSSTDPNTGPLLALLALAYWPVTTTAPRPPTAARRGRHRYRPQPSHGVATRR